MDAAPSMDMWAEWVLERSHADDAEQKRRSLEFLEPIRDRVLENAGIHAGDVVLDVGTGDGLITFGAMPLVGDSGRLIFCDFSQDLLEHCRAAALELGLADRAEFVRAAAEDLSPLPDESVDVVTTRSALIYVDQKDAAFREFHRVLSSGAESRSSSRSTITSPTTWTTSGGSTHVRSGTRREDLGGSTAPGAVAASPRTHGARTAPGLVLLLFYLLGDPLLRVGDDRARWPRPDGTRASRRARACSEVLNLRSIIT
jgi:SAM-dependent methyltransferase